MTTLRPKRKLAAIASLFLASQIWASENHAVQGILLEVNPARQSIVVSCDAIPGYMEPMVMPLSRTGVLTAMPRASSM